MNFLSKQITHLWVICILGFIVGCAQVPQYCGVNYSPVVNWEPDPNIGQPHTTPYTGTYFLGSYYPPICKQPPNGPKFYETGFPIKQID